MTNRIVLGQKGGDYGLWVSAPGHNVLTASESNMLFSMSGIMTQVIQSGSFTIDGSSTSVSIPITVSGSPCAIVYDNSQYRYDSSILVSDISSSSLTVYKTYKYPAGYTVSGFYMVFNNLI